MKYGTNERDNKDFIGHRFDRGLGRLGSSCRKGGARASLLDENRPEEAIQVFESSLSHNKLAADVWQGLADVHDQLGHSREAERCREAASKMKHS